MEHERAVQINAVDRYLLGELSEQERDLFEEHYFTCQECANEVRAGTMLAANARAVFRDREAWPRRASRSAPRWLEYFHWRPRFSLPAATAGLIILVALGYQTVTLRRQVKLASAVHIPAVVNIRPLARSGEMVAKLPKGADQILLRFIIPERYESYWYEIAREPDGVRLSGDAPPSASTDDLLLMVPASKLAPGRYRIRLRGSTGGRSVEIAQQELEIENR